MIKKKLPKTKIIDSCRLCFSGNLRKIYSLGNLFVSNFVEKNKIKNSVKAPLTLVHCNKCDLLQLQHSAPQELLYKGFYWYRSGVTSIMKNELRNIYNEGKKIAKLKKNDVVLDIGANDGTLLNYFKKKRIFTIGCEPAKNLINELKKRCNIVLNNFWNIDNFNVLKKKHNFKNPKLITAIGMFYDLEEPSIFIKDIFNALDDKGVFIAQLMCLSSMIEKNDLGNICHEHLEFYSYKSLKYLFESNGFEIFKVDKNDINGGSYRIYCRKSKDKIKSINLKENTSIKDIKKFFSRINTSKKMCLSFINREIKKGKKIYVYGASTKGNTILQYFNLNNKSIPFAAERSPQKWGKYTVGTGIKIISESEARRRKPDYFFVLPWAFMSEFLKREETWLKNGGKFIVPFPEFKIYSK